MVGGGGELVVCGRKGQDNFLCFFSFTFNFIQGLIFFKKKIVYSEDLFDGKGLSEYFESSGVQVSLSESLGGYPYFFPLQF